MQIPSQGLSYLQSVVLNLLCFMQDFSMHVDCCLDLPNQYTFFSLTYGSLAFPGPLVGKTYAAILLHFASRLLAA
uniref:Uncharacterized protein n=1 Tax=Oryza brachyantha TaxID=4533 RepID=J3NAF6_ORYBR